MFRDFVTMLATVTNLVPIFFSSAIRYIPLATTLFANSAISTAHLRACNTHQASKLLAAAKRNVS